MKAAARSSSSKAVACRAVLGGSTAVRRGRGSTNSRLRQQYQRLLLKEAMDGREAKREGVVSPSSFVVVTAAAASHHLLPCWPRLFPPPSLRSLLHSPCIGTKGKSESGATLLPRARPRFSHASFLPPRLSSGHPTPFAPLPLNNFHLLLRSQCYRYHDHDHQRSSSRLHPRRRRCCRRGRRDRRLLLIDPPCGRFCNRRLPSLAPPNYCYCCC